MPRRPTESYASLDAAYEHFNQALFGGTLPPCLITVQRDKGSYGYFHGDRFECLDSGDRHVTDEIALNPMYFAERPVVEVLATLVHEMVHLWQHHFGQPSRRGYHNQQWAARMRAVGLIPIALGQPEGTETGQKVHHAIDPAGRFAQAATEFLRGATTLLYQDRQRSAEAERTRKAKAASKTKYTCPECGLNAWAKPEAHLLCGDCEEPMQAEPPADAGD
jgi:predicted SprT family Zn-dependent metalloprotease